MIFTSEKMRNKSGFIAPENSDNEVIVALITSNDNRQYNTANSTQLTNYVKMRSEKKPVSDINFKYSESPKNGFITNNEGKQKMRSTPLLLNNKLDKISERSVLEMNKLSSCDLYSDKDTNFVKYLFPSEMRRGSISLCLSDVSKKKKSHKIVKEYKSFSRTNSKSKFTNASSSRVKKSSSTPKSKGIETRHNKSDIKPSSRKLTKNPNSKLHKKSRTANSKEHTQIKPKMDQSKKLKRNNTKQRAQSLSNNRSKTYRVTRNDNMKLNDINNRNHSVTKFKPKQSYMVSQKNSLIQSPSIGQYNSAVMDVTHIEALIRLRKLEIKQIREKYKLASMAYTPNDFAFVV